MRLEMERGPWHGSSGRRNPGAVLANDNPKDHQRKIIRVSRIKGVRLTRHMPMRYLAAAFASLLHIISAGDGSCSYSLMPAYHNAHGHFTSESSPKSGSFDRFMGGERADVINQLMA